MQVNSYTEAGIYVNYKADYTTPSIGVEESVEIMDMSFRIDPDRSVPIPDALKDVVAKAILEYVWEECRAQWRSLNKRSYLTGSSIEQALTNMNTINRMARE